MAFYYENSVEKQVHDSLRTGGFIPAGGGGRHWWWFGGKWFFFPGGTGLQVRRTIWQRRRPRSKMVL